MESWIRWGWYAKIHGLQNVYHSDTIYNPFSQYLLWAYAGFFPSEEALRSGIWGLKYLSFAADIIGVYFVWLWINKKHPFSYLLLFSLLNIAFYFNGVFWGQIDGIMSLFMFLSIYYLWQKKANLGAVFLALALGMKLQAIIFIPVFGLLIFVLYPKQEWFKKIAMSLAVFLLSLFVLSIPFLTNAANITAFKEKILVQLTFSLM